MIKDYGDRPGWWRMTLGRYLLARECAAYRRLQGIPGIPALAGFIDPWAIATGFVEGRDLSLLRRGSVSANFFARLLDLLDSIHRAGVAQGDLHHRDVIMGLSGDPFLVDFSTAVFCSPTAWGIRRRLFEAACASDRRAALKLKNRHVPDALTAEERQVLDHDPAWHRLGKAVRGLLLAKRKGRHDPAEN